MQPDTLQFFPTEEGRVRYIPADSTIPAQNAMVENQLFDNVSSTTVVKSTASPGFDSDPNNKQVSQLDGSAGNDSQPRVGPSIVLKVMAGDTITIGTYAWYQGTVEPPPSGASNLLNDLLNALTGGVVSNSHGLYNTTDNDPNTILSGDLGQFFTNEENNNYSTTAPKAFLNYVAFDNQMNMVSANSGVVHVPTITGSEPAQPLVAPEQIIQKDGYLYIYVSNESVQNVFFDNLVIHHNRGPILQTDNYYPFGLTMAGISDQAALSEENNYKFNGKLLNHKEFSDNTGLDWYSYGMREYDPQIGRFFRVDPLTNKFPYLTPYQFASNEPVRHIDIDGMEEGEAPDMYGLNPVSEGEELRQITTFEVENEDKRGEVINYFEPKDEPLDPQITKGNKMGKAVVEMTKGIEAIKNHIESLTEKQDVFIDADGKETVQYEPAAIQFKDKKSEIEFNQMQSAYEGKEKFMISTIPKPKDPGPNATPSEKAKYLHAMEQYGLNVGLTKSLMDANSPKQQLINSIMKDPHTKEKPTVVEPLPSIRPWDH